MKEKVYEAKRGFLGRLFRLKPVRISKYFCDSMDDFLANADRKGYFILRDLTVGRKTPEKVIVEGNGFHTSYATRYYFIFKDSTTQIGIRSLTERTYVSMGSSFRNYSPETWSNIINAREGDIVGIAFSKNGREEWILTNLENKTLEERVNEPTHEKVSA